MNIDSADKPIENEEPLNALSETPSRKKRSTEKREMKCCRATLIASLILWMFILIVALSAAIPTAQLVIALIHPNGCPMNPMIVQYLKIAGISGIAYACIIVLQVK